MSRLRWRGAGGCHRPRAVDAPVPSVVPPASWRELLRLSLPMAVAMGLGFFLHYANRMVLSWHSPEAMAAGLPAGMLAWTVQSLFILVCGYLGTFAAQHTAAGEDRAAGAYVWPMLAVALGAAVLMAALIPCSPAIAGFFGVAPEVHAPLATLLAWYWAETPLVAVLAGISGFAGGIGRTGLVLAMSLAGCVGCILLNAWLVLGGLGVPALGAHGAGAASLLTSLALAGAWWTWMLGGDRRARFAVWAQRGWHGARLRRFLVLALPRGLSEVLEMAAFIAFTAVIARLGTDLLGASNAAFTTYIMGLVPLMGIAQGVGIAVGQAQGAGRPDLARLVVRRGAIIVTAVAAIMAGLLLLLPHTLLAPMRAPDLDDARWRAMLADAWPVCIGLAFAAVGDSLIHLYRFALGGAGDTRWPLAMMVLCCALGLALPAWIAWMLIDDPRTVLWACYLVFGGAMWLMAGLLAWRWYRGPWPRMGVRG